MHEMSLCMSMLELVEEQAMANDCQTVSQIWLEVGALSGVEVDSFKFCFDVARKQTVAKDCILHIIKKPTKMLCMDCDFQDMVEQRLQRCPACHGYVLTYSGGNEFRLKELEAS